MSGSAQAVVAAALGVVSFLSSSIPFGLLFGRWFTGRDVREVGSGNIGAANVSRLAGRRVAVLVLVADLLKGLVPVLIARLIGLNPIDLAIIAGVAVLGHDFSPFLRFRGGKGVATTIGVCAGIAILPTICAAVVWLAVAGLTRVSAAASLLSLWLLALLMAGFDQPPEFVCLAFGLSMLSVYTHRDNIARMAAGKENRVGRG